MTLVYNRDIVWIKIGYMSHKPRCTIINKNHIIW